MTINIAKYRRPGVFLEEFNRTIRTTPPAVFINQLVMGSSRKGPMNKLVYLQNSGEREEVFGKIDRNLEYKQSFFHRTIDVCLRSGPVWALNLLPVEEQDVVTWRSLSTSSSNPNGTAQEEPISNFFDKTDFWEKSVEQFLFIANRGIEPIDQKKILHIANMSEKKITIFAFKSYIKGFDITAADWYVGAQNVPTFMYPTDLISDYFIQVAVIGGDWTDYQSLSSDLNWSRYYNDQGLIKSKFLEFINDSRINLIGYWDVCLIPNFRDKNGRAYFIEETINNTFDRTGLLVSYDTTKLEDTDFPAGLVDLVGNCLVEGQDMIEFLSYKENIMDRLLFETKYLSESDADGVLINKSGIPSYSDENISNVFFMPDRREINSFSTILNWSSSVSYLIGDKVNFLGQIYEALQANVGQPAPDINTNDWALTSFGMGIHKYASTPQRSFETDLSEYAVVGLETKLIYTRDYLKFNDNNLDTNPAEEYISSDAPPVNPERVHTYGVDINITNGEGNPNLPWDNGQFLNTVASPSNQTLFFYSALNIKKIEMEKMSGGLNSDCYYVINGKKIYFDQIINPNNVEDNFKPYITIGPFKPNWRTDIILPQAEQVFANGVGLEPRIGRIDLILLNDQGHLTVLKGNEFTVGVKNSSNVYFNPVMTLSTAIPELPNGNICVGYVTMGIRYNSDTEFPSTQWDPSSFVHYFPVQIGRRGPIVDKNIHLKYNADAEKVLESQPTITPNSLPILINGEQGSVPLAITSPPYLKYQEPLPNADYLYYNKVKTIDILFFKTNNNTTKFTVGNLFHNAGAGITPNTNGQLTITGPSYALDESTAGSYYHNIITLKRYQKLKGRLIGGSGTSIVQGQIENYSNIQNAQVGVNSWKNTEVKTAKAKFSRSFVDPTTVENAKISMILDNQITVRAGKLTINYVDSEQLFGTKKMTTTFSNQIIYYDIKPNSNSSTMPAEFETTPIGLNSGIYQKYIDGYINTKDFFYQVMFASDLEFSLKFTIETDSNSEPSYRIYIDHIDPSIYGNIIGFETYGNVISSAGGPYDNTVLRYTQYLNSHTYQDIIPDVGTRIYIKGSNLNDGFYTVKNIGFNTVGSLTSQFIEVNEPVISETNTKITGNGIDVPPYVDKYFVNRIRMYSAEKIYMKIILVNNDLEITYYNDQNLTEQVIRITPLTAYIGLEVYSLKDNLKQTIDVIKLGTQSNQVVIDSKRYGEINVGDYLDAFYDVNSIQPGQFPKVLTRILKKDRIKDDPSINQFNQVLLTCDTKIKVAQSGNSIQTQYYKSIDNYATTLKGLMFNNFKMRADLFPDGTEERQDKILDMILPDTNLFKGLINKDGVEWRYLVDCYGLGLTTNSKQQYLDLLNSRQDSLGFINMPSISQFRNSVNPSFVNNDGSVNVEFIKLGGDPSQNPSFLYTFGTGYGQTYVGYFLPWVKINDGGVPITMPPASYVAQAYMRKHSANATGIGPGSIVAGLEQGPIVGILDVEMDFNGPDIEHLKELGANPILHKMNNGFCLEMQNTASVTPQSALSNIHVREVLIQLEKELRNMLLQYQWKFNTPDVRADIKFRADAICKKYKDRNYLYDFFNIIDESNNTLDVINSGIGVLDTFVEPVRGLEILVNNVTILNQGDISSGRFQIA